MKKALKKLKYVQLFKTLLLKQDFENEIPDLATQNFSNLNTGFFGFVFFFFFFWCRRSLKPHWSGFKRAFSAR